MTDQAFELSETQRPVRANATVPDTITRLPLPRPNKTSTLSFATAWKHSRQAWTSEGARNIRDWIVRSRWHILGAFVTCLGTVIAMLALKPAFVGEKSSERALDLAEWTATKDFFEYCSVLETKGEIPQTCVNILNETSPPPPHLEHSKKGMARLSAELPEITKRAIGLRTASILRHDKLMSRLGFAVTGLAVLLIYIARLYRRQNSNITSPQLDSTSYQASPTPAIWRPTPRRRQKETPQPVGSSQKHNNTEIRYRGSQKPQPEREQVTTSFGSDDIASAYMRSDQYQPRDYSLLLRQREAEERYEADILASRGSLGSYVEESVRQSSEKKPVHMLSGRLEIERRLRKLDIDEVEESRYWEAVLG